MSTYSEKLKNPKWQKKRLEILQRDNFKCSKCADTETELQIHHLKYTGNPWDAPNENLITVCKHCHFILEDAKEKHFEIIGIEDGGFYKIVLLKDGIAYYSLDFSEFPEYLCVFSYNSISLKHLYNLSIK